MSQRLEADRRWPSVRDVLMLAGGIVLASAAMVVWTTWTRSEPAEEREHEQAAARETSSHEVRVSRDVLAAAGIEIVPVTVGMAADRVQTTGVVETNQQQIHHVTPLVGGRVERVHVSLGDRVQTGTVLLTLSSPQIAELEGNLRAAEAKLAQADATLARTQRLVDLGAGAGKDLVAAEAEQRTARAQVAQLRQSLQVLGAPPRDDAGQASMVAIRSPMAGNVIERGVNAGAWIEPGTSVLTLADLTTVWVVANVPEGRLSLVRLRAPVEIRAPTLSAAFVGRVNYLDPQLDQETRTARVRVDVSNPEQRLKIGMFVEMTIEGPPDTRATALTVPAEAIQRIGERTVVFVPTAEAERFEVRDIDVGDEIQGRRIVRSGLAAGDRVVTGGGFTLKSQLLRGQFGEEEEIAGKER
jgi:cobalt-zinc-cadmium efflux system membrane fusion protein